LHEDKKVHYQWEDTVPPPMFNVKNLPTKEEHSKETASTILFSVLNQIQSDMYFEGNRYFGFSN